jgi:hypothetical protein
MTSNKEYCEFVFEEVSKLTLNLDDNPLQWGPKRLNEKVSKSRNISNALADFIVELVQRISHQKNKLLNLTSLFKAERSHLLSNDPIIKAGRSAGEREALVAVRLKDQVEEIEQAESELEQLEAVMGVVKMKKADIRNLRQDLKDQVTLVLSEIKLGSKWGDLVTETLPDFASLNEAAPKPLQPKDVPAQDADSYLSDLPQVQLDANVVTLPDEISLDVEEFLSA